MNRVLLFAIDYKKNEVIVSESSKENNKINFIERIKKSDNNIFFNTSFDHVFALNPFGPC